MPVLIPLFMGPFLVCRHRLLPAGVCGQVAGDGGLNVNSLHEEKIVPQGFP